MLQGKEAIGKLLSEANEAIDKVEHTERDNITVPSFLNVRKYERRQRYHDCQIRIIANSTEMNDSIAVCAHTSMFWFIHTFKVWVQTAGVRHGIASDRDPVSLTVIGSDGATVRP
eukprot:767584-Hanusia_phi.AAC.1